MHAFRCAGQPYLLVLVLVLLGGCRMDRELAVTQEEDDYLVLSQPDEYLVCEPLAAETVTDTVGTGGGMLQVGANRLDFPGQALQRATQFTVSQLTDGRIGVVVQGEPRPRLRRTVTLSLDFGHCGTEQLGEVGRWFIWRFANEHAAGGQPLGAVVDGTTLRTYVGETSLFVIAH
jgi:hypothetical protein